MANTTHSPVSPHTAAAMGQPSTRSGHVTYQTIRPACPIPKETCEKLGHPISRVKLVVVLVVALILPVAIISIAFKQLGRAMDYPFYMLLIPSLIFTPVIFCAYKFRGARPYIRGKPITLLMTLTFLYFSLLVPVYLAYLLAGLYNRSTLGNTPEAYHPLAWLVSLPIAYLHVCVFTQYAALSQAAMRSVWYCRLISWPSSVFFTTIVVSLPFFFIAPFLPSVATSIVMLIPLGISIMGLSQTLRTRPPTAWAVKDILVRTSNEEDDQLLTKRVVHRVKCSSPLEHEVVDFRQPLSIIQIADPHLGPMMSVERLEEICENTVKLNPDLVLLTGDFFTAECFNPEGAIDIALSPLKKLSGRTFACLGEHIQKVCEAFPPIPSISRIAMLHDPGAFKFIPSDYGTLVFSGHTHGGQIGLNMFGINLSVVGMTGMPANDLWKHGHNYLYVHTGQGCRSLMGNMILRVGVPTEDSLLQVYFEN
eukprot:gene11433-13329_t